MFFKMGQPRPLFRFFLSFQTNNFYNKSMWKMSIQYTAQGFKPTTFRTWVVTHNHQTRASTCLPVPRLEFFQRSRPEIGIIAIPMIMIISKKNSISIKITISAIFAFDTKSITKQAGIKKQHVATIIRYKKYFVPTKHKSRKKISRSKYNSKQRVSHNKSVSKTTRSKYHSIQKVSLGRITRCIKSLVGSIILYLKYHVVSRYP